MHKEFSNWYPSSLLARNLIYHCSFYNVFLHKSWTFLLQAQPNNFRGCENQNSSDVELLRFTAVNITVNIHCLQRSGSQGFPGPVIVKQMTGSQCFVYYNRQDKFSYQDFLTDWVQLWGLGFFSDWVHLSGLLCRLGSVIRTSLQTGHSWTPVWAVCHDHCCRTL